MRIARTTQSKITLLLEPMRKLRIVSRIQHFQIKQSSLVERMSLALRSLKQIKQYLSI